MKATEVTAGLAESNGSLLPGLWRDSLHVACELTACTPGSAPGPTLGNEYGKTLPFLLSFEQFRLLLLRCSDYLIASYVITFNQNMFKTSIGCSWSGGHLAVR